MFDFEKLDVYKKAKELNKDILALIRKKKIIDDYISDQLKRASISTILNIAEGSGKFSLADKRNYYTIARGSVYECVSLLEIMADEKNIDKNEFTYFYSQYETISKMLMGLIKSQLKEKE